MEHLTSEENENRYALLAAIVAAFVVASAVGFVFFNEEDDDAEPVRKKTRVAGSSLEPDEPEIEQAPWKIIAVPTASLGQTKKKQVKAVRKTAPKVKAAVRDIYDALTVSRFRFNEATKLWMRRPAAHALRKSTPIPKELTKIQTTRREAKIGIDLRTRAQAAARVVIAFKADQGSKRVWYYHRSTLWLERGERGWEVIAYDLDQRSQA